MRHISDRTLDPNNLRGIRIRDTVIYLIQCEKQYDYSDFGGIFYMWYKGLSILQGKWLRALSQLALDFIVVLTLPLFEFKSKPELRLDLRIFLRRRSS